MKKIVILLSLIVILLSLSGFSLVKTEYFNETDLYDVQKIYETEEIEACALGRTKTYMDYRTVTNTSSTQYWYIKNVMHTDEKTGFLLDEDGFIGVALGTYFGPVGSRYYITLESGVVIPVIKIDQKDDRHTDSNGCAQRWDGSVFEFVIDSDIADRYYGHYANGLVLQGNYSNYYLYQGSIVKIEKVLDEKRDDYVTYLIEDLSPVDYSIFDYASGY